MSTAPIMRIATRGSALARWQAEHIGQLIRGRDSSVETELVVVDTEADRGVGVPIWKLGGKGAFVKEVQAAVLDGRADAAVHSAKDLPSVTHPELVLAAVPKRGDPRDAMVGSRLDRLPPGALVGTGSARRRAQLADRRPDLTFAELRGNIHTRLAKAASPDLDAIVVAAAALERLGLQDHVAERLATTTVVPQAGQGALAVECREGDEVTFATLAGIEHAPSRLTVDAERSFLAELGGDCDVPAGAHAVLRADGTLRLVGVIASLDGRIVLLHGAEGPDPAALGPAVARHLLDTSGGRAVLELG